MGAAVTRERVLRCYLPYVKDRELDQDPFAPHRLPRTTSSQRWQSGPVAGPSSARVAEKRGPPPKRKSAALEFVVAERRRDSLLPNRRAAQQRYHWSRHARRPPGRSRRSPRRTPPHESKRLPGQIRPTAAHDDALIVRHDRRDIDLKRASPVRSTRFCQTDRSPRLGIDWLARQSRRSLPHPAGYRQR
jgi:hypothetical protein